MPSIKRRVTADTADALNGLKFKTQVRPSLVSLWASQDAVGGAISYSVGSEKELLVDGQVNLEAAADVVDTSRDQILFREPAPAGEHFLPITVATTDCTFLVLIELI